MVRGYFSELASKRKRYEKVISNDNYRKKLLAKQKEYREKNKEKIKQYKREMKELSIKLGNCIKCHKPKKKDKYKMCEKCREYGRNAKKKAQS
jgi:hypothetical protein